MNSDRLNNRVDGVAHFLAVVKDEVSDAKMDVDDEMAMTAMKASGMAVGMDFRAVGMDLGARGIALSDGGLA